MMRWTRFVVVGLMFAASSMCAGAQSSSDPGAQSGGRFKGNGSLSIADCVGIGGASETSREMAADDKGRGFDVANLDRSVSPCQDFYQFATGGWAKANPIPAAYPRWGSFTILQEHNQDVLRTIL